MKYGTKTLALFLLYLFPPALVQLQRVARRKKEKGNATATNATFQKRKKKKKITEGVLHDMHDNIPKREKITCTTYKKKDN